MSLRDFHFNSCYPPRINISNDLCIINHKLAYRLYNLKVVVYFYDGNDLEKWYDPYFHIVKRNCYTYRHLITKLESILYL